VGAVVGGDKGQSGAVQALAGDVRHSRRGGACIRRGSTATPRVKGSDQFQHSSDGTCHCHVIIIVFIGEEEQGEEY